MSEVVAEAEVAQGAAVVAVVLREDPGERELREMISLAEETRAKRIMA
jgi:hypothetical protein